MKDMNFSDILWILLASVGLSLIANGLFDNSRKSNERIRTLEQQVDGLREKIKHSN